ncbi:Mediator of RNA polymerase II transcription [Echinococcus multilocularis]|uniref:Mediator of RNA polymerase II transcription subunit 22 n=1 Tax=Echinococcus multilocularis TaxID=6211 RepID=A0A068Y2K4_ECHMU|nr:Mediator of RNA polymerase II transcription [Echinococcus multilocularis]
MQPVGRVGSTVPQVHSRKRDTYLNNLNSRLRESLKSIQENYELMLSRAKMENHALLNRCDPYALATQENFECNVRAANIVNACESITRLVSEIKQLLLLGDFRWLETAVREDAEERDRRRADLDAVATRLHEEVSRDLCALEEVLGPTRPSSQGHTSQT